MADKQRGMIAMLRALKRRTGSAMKTAIVAAPLPLGVQAAAIEWLLPMDPWPRSLAYQQCLANRVLSRYGPFSQSGPFEGMHCIRDADEGCLIPKLLGCYEEELITTAESFIQRGCDRLIDVGCASGYWLTGLALRMPKIEAFGFDTDNAALARCAELNALNKVQSRIKLFGACAAEDLERHITKRTLVFVDCDGPEYHLLDPQLAPSLRRADIIVECHDFINPLITPTLLERFKYSHSIERVSSRPREPSPEKYPGLRALPPEHWAAAVDERRPCIQEWLVMRTKLLEPAN